MLPFLIAAGAGGVLIAAVIAVQRTEKARTAAVEAAAARLGWTYRGAASLKSIADLDRFELFTQGRRRKLSNLMTSPGGDPRSLLFDYSYTTGGGNAQSRHHQTVFYAVSDALQLPTFSLRPQRFIHGIAKMFGYQDIDLHGRPQFSEMFVLRGEDEAAVREVFGAAVADFFEGRASACAAGVGHELLYWRREKRLSGDEIESFVNDGLELVERFGGRRDA
jgi:carbonic anhydrase